MKKTKAVITNPEDLNKYLQYTSPVTWIVLVSVILIFAGFFVFASLFKMQVKLNGVANIVDSVVALNVKEESLSKLKEGQYVYFTGTDVKVQIMSFYENGQPKVDNVSLDNGEHPYYIVLEEIRPISFLIGR